MQSFIVFALDSVHPRPHLFLINWQFHGCLKVVLALRPVVLLVLPLPKLNVLLGNVQTLNRCELNALFVLSHVFAKR